MATRKFVIKKKSTESIDAAAKDDGKAVIRRPGAATPRKTDETGEVVVKRRPTTRTRRVSDVSGSKRRKTPDVQPVGSPDSTDTTNGSISLGRTPPPTDDPIVVPPPKVQLPLSPMALPNPDLEDPTAFLPDEDVTANVASQLIFEDDADDPALKTLATKGTPAADEEMFKFYCCRCGQKLKVLTSWAGHMRACPICHHEILVPHPLSYE